MRTTKQNPRVGLRESSGGVTMVNTLNRRYRGGVMTLRPVTVECYSGSRADERPRKIRTGGREYVVMKLLAESVDESFVTKARNQRYKVLTDEGLILELVRDEDGSWFLEEKTAD